MITTGAATTDAGCINAVRALQRADPGRTAVVHPATAAAPNRDATAVTGDMSDDECLQLVRVAQVLDASGEAVIRTGTAFREE